MTIKKKSVKKSIRKEVSASPRYIITKEHKSALILVEQLNKKINKYAEQIALAVKRVKNAKTPAVKEKAKVRLTTLKASKLETSMMCRNAKKEVIQLEKTAKELARMLAAKEKAMVAFAKRWEADYLKQKIRQKKLVQSRVKRKSSKKSIVS